MFMQAPQGSIAVKTGQVNLASINGDPRRWIGIVQDLAWDGWATLRQQATPPPEMYEALSQPKTQQTSCY